jgi:hypothetical protein
MPALRAQRPLFVGRSSLIVALTVITNRRDVTLHMGGSAVRPARLIAGTKTAGTLLADGDQWSA